MDVKATHELPGFKYLIEIGIENEHSNSATLSDK